MAGIGRVDRMRAGDRVEPENRIAGRIGKAGPDLFGRLDDGDLPRLRDIARQLHCGRSPAETAADDDDAPGAHRASPKMSERDM